MDLLWGGAVCRQAIWCTEPPLIIKNLFVAIYTINLSLLYLCTDSWLILIRIVKSSDCNIINTCCNLSRFTKQLCWSRFKYFQIFIFQMFTLLTFYTKCIIMWISLPTLSFVYWIQKAQFCFWENRYISVPRLFVRITL